MGASGRTARARVRVESDRGVADGAGGLVVLGKRDTGLPRCRRDGGAGRRWAGPPAGGRAEGHPVEEQQDGQEQGRQAARAHRTEA